MIKSLSRWSGHNTTTLFQEATDKDNLVCILLPQLEQHTLGDDGLFLLTTFQLTQADEFDLQWNFLG